MGTRAYLPQSSSPVFPLLVRTSYTATLTATEADDSYEDDFSTPGFSCIRVLFISVSVHRLA